MEDWERFFVEKSQRRFDKERSERRRQRVRTSITAGLLIVLILGGVAALAILP